MANAWRLAGLVVLAGVALAGGVAIWWGASDADGRARIERRLHDVPVVRSLVPDPGSTIEPASPGRILQVPGGAGPPSVVYPAK